MLSMYLRKFLFGFAKPKREMSIFEIMSKAMAGPKENTKVKEDSIAVERSAWPNENGKPSILSIMPQEIRVC